MKSARILIADDHLLTLEGIRSVLGAPHTIVGAVFVTMHANPAYLDAGGEGYVLKTAAREELEVAVESVHPGPSLSITLVFLPVPRRNSGCIL